MKRKITLASLLLGAALCSTALIGQTWHEAFYNVLVKGILFVGTGTPSVTQGAGDVYIGDGLEVDGATRLDGAATLNGAATFESTVTENSTHTANGVIVVNSRQAGLIPWVTTYDPINDNGFEVTGIAMPDTNYQVYLQTTANVTPIDIIVDSANQFRVELQAAVPADVTQRFIVVPTDESL